MGSTLMKLPIFKESIQKNHNVLKKFDIDLIQIITDTDPSTINNTVNSLVGITAMQVIISKSV